MRLFDWRCLVLSSLLAGALTAAAETRPQYGGTLHIAMREAPSSLDPADASQPDSFAHRSLTMLLFDTLVSSDGSGGVKASLSTSWQASQGNRRWQFHLRRGVKFHDSTLLTAEIVAGSLRAANPAWNVQVEGESVVIVIEAANPEMLEELALPRNAIAKRNADSTPSGTGAFHVTDWQPGKKLTLTAEENCWRGRPFLDSIEVEMGKSFREQMTELDLGKADLVEIAAEQERRASQEGHHLTSSAPLELLALVFAREVATPDDKLLREALALSVERASIRNVLLQGSGQPTAGILPTWMSGYGFVFSTAADLPRARQEREQIRTVSAWSIGYDGSDPVSRLLAERIALNARDAGLTLQPTSTAPADLRLVRIPLNSPDPWIALEDVAARCGLPAANGNGGSAEDLYAAERALLATQRIIPLFHLSASYAASGNLKNWKLRPDGSWDLGDAWLGSGKP